MKRHIILIVSILSLSASSAIGAEKNKTLIQLDTVRSAVGSAAVKVEGNKEASADLERARAALTAADESYKAGKSFFGDMSPELEKEIKLSVDMADIATATALSRVEFVRATAEMAAIEKQSAAVRSKLKLFEDRKAELARLRLEVAACQKTTKELEVIKLEKFALTAQAELLVVERTRADKLKIEQLELNRKMDEMKAENTRLAGQLEKQQAEIKVLPTAPPVEEKKRTRKP